MITFLVILQEILGSHSDEKITELSESVLQLLERHLPGCAGASGEEKESLVQLQGAGVSLWNKAVALKSAGAINLKLNAQSK